MKWIIRLIEKTGVLGTIISAMGCAACFPALGALAASLGLGFLSQYEGIFINKLVPVFAWVAIGANVASFLMHRKWFRMLAGVTGPVMVLLTLYPLWSYGWSTYLFYTGLVLMFMVAVWDLVSPPRSGCSTCKKIEVQV